MILAKVDCPTILRMVMVPDEAGDVVAAEVVVVQDMATVAMVALRPAWREVAAPLPTTAVMPLQPAPVLRLMATQMMMHNSFMIT